MLLYKVLPLHDCRMSNPITCLTQRQDTLFHILYCSDNLFMQRLIEESVINLAREYSSKGVHEVLVDLRPTPSDTLDKLRAKFFILLNQDMQMKRKLSMQHGKSSLINEVCEHKATRFYSELNANLIPAFAQDQKMPLATFVENIRDVYTYS